MAEKERHGQCWHQDPHSLSGRSCREFYPSESPPHDQNYLLHELAMSTISSCAADSRHAAIRHLQQQQELDDVVGISSAALLHAAPSRVDQTS